MTATLSKRLALPDGRVVVIDGIHEVETPAGTLLVKFNAHHDAHGRFAAHDGPTIGTSQAAAWLAGSAHPHVVIHETSEEAAHAIREHGVDISRAKWGTFGAGFYATSSDSEGTASGEGHRMQVAIRLTNPIKGTPAEVRQRMQEVLPFDGKTVHTPHDVRAAMVAAGHDGVILHRSDGETWVAAYHPHSVKVVVPDHEVAKFNPNHDAHGEFASAPSTGAPHAKEGRTGHPGKSQGTSTPSAAPMRAGASIGATAKANRFIEKGATFDDLGRAKEKARIATKLAARLADHPDAVAAARTVSLNPKRLDDPKTRKAEMTDIVSHTLGVWADTSADQNPHAHAFQKAVAEEFGLHDAYASLAQRTGYAKPGMSGAGIIDRHVPLYRHVARAMYDETQVQLAKAGIKEVGLYRGYGTKDQEAFSRHKNASNGEGVEVTVHHQPASSWSSQHETAFTFAAESATHPLTGMTDPKRAITLEATVPAARILSTARTGAGCLPEYEYVVLGGPGKAAAHTAHAFPDRMADSGHDWGDWFVKKSAPTYEAETAQIKRRATSDYAQGPHDFEPAYWTHPNGHPRCKVCGDEEAFGGRCNMPTAWYQAQAQAEYGDTLVAKYNPYHDPATGHFASHPMVGGFHLGQKVKVGGFKTDYLVVGHEGGNAIVQPANKPYKAHYAQGVHNLTPVTHGPGPVDDKFLHPSGAAHAALESLAALHAAHTAATATAASTTPSPAKPKYLPGDDVKWGKKTPSFEFIKDNGDGTVTLKEKWNKKIHAAVPEADIRHPQKKGAKGTPAAATSAPTPAAPAAPAHPTPTTPPPAPKPVAPPHGLKVGDQVEIDMPDVPANLTSGVVHTIHTNGGVTVHNYDYDTAIDFTHAEALAGLKPVVHPAHPYTPGTKVKWKNKTASFTVLTDHGDGTFTLKENWNQKTHHGAKLGDLHLPGQKGAPKPATAAATTTQAAPAAPKAGKPTAGKSDHTAETKAVWKGNTKASGFIKPSAPLPDGTVDMYSGTHKSNINASIAARLLQHPERMEAIRNALGVPVTHEVWTDPAKRKRLMQEVTDLTVSKWAGTSGDNHINALNAQRAAAEEFGLHESWEHTRQRVNYDNATFYGNTEGTAYVTGHGFGHMAGSEANTFSKRLFADNEDQHQHYARTSGAFRAVLRTMYEHTQDGFAKAGIKEVGLYRGYKEHGAPPWKSETAYNDGKGVPHTPLLQPMSSFSSKLSTSKGFSGGDTIIRGTIPVSRIIGTAKTGYGCLNEQEFVVLAGPGKLLAHHAYSLGKKKKYGYY